MDINDQISYDDPQFVRVLGTCLKMEIATSKEKVEENLTMIKKMKMIMKSELERRKQLKEKVAQMEKTRSRLNESLTRLRANISEVSDTLEMMKTNTDDQYMLMELRSQEYQNIIAEYRETSQAYHAMYEEFPLAKVRNEAKADLRKLQVAHMVMDYKKAEITKIIQQRRRIDWIRTRCKIVEFAGVMVQRSRLMEKLTRLRVNVEYHSRELNSLETEMRTQRKKEEERKKLRRQKMLEMAPPKINIPYRQIYAQTQMRARAQQQWKRVQESFDDTISVNTVVLEELCINEDAAMSTEIEVARSKEYSDPKSAAIQRESSNLKKLIDLEKIDTPTDSLIVSDVEVNAEKAASVDNDVEMKETYREETTQKKSQESTKTRADSCTKENLLKHSVAKNTEDEIEAKRMRLQRDDSHGSSSNKITVPSLSITVEDAGSKSSPLIPKIRKIETVHYDLTLISKAALPSDATTNRMLSPNYEYCDSNMSSFDQSFMKDSISLCEGSLCNYKLSPASNISPFCPDEDARMISSPIKQPDDKNQPDQETSPFQFSNLATKAKGNFTIF